MARNPDLKTVDDFASTLDSDEKVNAVKTRYDLPLDLEARAPLGTERANSPPEGRITVYDRFMHLGLRFPLFPLFEEIVQYYKTHLARFTLNLITFMLGFAKICQREKVKPQLILWRYLFQVVVPSTSFQDWYIVKRCLRPGVKKMVEAYCGSPEWKPEYLFVKASEKYCVAWNWREVEGLGVIKDAWSKEDDNSVEEFADDLKKVLKYSKLVKWSGVPYYVMSSSNAGSRLYGDEDPFPIINSDEDVSTTAGAQEKFVPQTVKETCLPPMETRPSSVPPVAYKGKNPLEGEAVTLPSQMFEGGPTVVVHTFGNPPTIECPILEEFAAQLNETDSVRLAKMISTDGMAAAIEEVNMAVTNPKKVMHEALVNVLTKLSAEQLLLWESLSGALIKMGTPEEIAMFPGDTPTVLSNGPSDEETIPEVPDEYMD
ncbi:OLC1v1001084C1 [Oldenlandia corymbosa var. corymbosa]|uniref:OLC1v1001084C1 n=1 Tax=Oldenlandia corymbosa var. corymbosa TaxID=529605 RepID=A0AAV1D4H2_OLDCO|nr:OLC1v1001084C1 [Oldenlandia corymbosa var. corymbosa]